MDLKKIGNLIAELRKKKNLTQDQLGEKIGVSGKTVSKWENGIYAPNISLLNKLSEALETTTTELLNGETINIEIPKNISDKTVDSLYFYTEQTTINLWKKFVIYFIILFLTFSLLIVSIFVKNNYNNCITYEISSSNKQYLVNGFIFMSPEKDILVINNIENAADENYYDVQAYSYEYSLIFDNVTIWKEGNLSLYEHQKDDELIKFDEILSNIHIYNIEPSRYDEIILKNRLKNNNICLRILYYDKEMKMQSKEIKLQLKIIYSNNKMFYDGGKKFNVSEFYRKNSKKF